MSVARARAARRVSPRARKNQGSSTFSWAVNARSRWNAWNTMPTCRARSSPTWCASRSLTGCPSRTTLPRVGARSRASTDTRVDLPLPERPTMAVQLARGKPTVTWRSAATGPVGEG